MFHVIARPAAGNLRAIAVVGRVIVVVDNTDFLQVCNAECFGREDANRADRVVFQRFVVRGFHIDTDRVFFLTHPNFVMPIESEMRINRRFINAT